MGYLYCLDSHATLHSPVCSGSVLMSRGISQTRTRVLKLFYSDGDPPMFGRTVLHLHALAVLGLCVIDVSAHDRPRTAYVCVFVFDLAPRGTSVSCPNAPGCMPAKHFRYQVSLSGFGAQLGGACGNHLHATSQISGLDLWLALGFYVWWLSGEF